MYLIINTTIKDTIQLILIKNQLDYIENSWNTPKEQSEKLLFLIDKFFKQNKILLKNIKGIAVVNGPGAFSSLRLACTTANTLVFCLKIPVIGVKIKEYQDIDKLIRISIKELQKEAKFKLTKQIIPYYNKEPNIT